jgi:hypothetical protein
MTSDDQLVVISIDPARDTTPVSRSVIRFMQQIMRLFYLVGPEDSARLQGMFRGSQIIEFNTLKPDITYLLVVVMNHMLHVADTPVWVPADSAAAAVKFHWLVPHALALLADEHLLKSSVFNRGKVYTVDLAMSLDAVWLRLRRAAEGGTSAELDTICFVPCVDQCPRCGERVSGAQAVLGMGSDGVFRCAVCKHELPLVRHAPARAPSATAQCLAHARRLLRECERIMRTERLPRGPDAPEVESVRERERMRELERERERERELERELQAMQRAEQATRARERVTPPWLRT